MGRSIVRSLRSVIITLAIDISRPLSLYDEKKLVKF
jgi:hypothetical protein